MKQTTPDEYVTVNRTHDPELWAPLLTETGVHRILNWIGTNDTVPFDWLEDERHAWILYELTTDLVSATISLTFIASAPGEPHQGPRLICTLDGTLLRTIPNSVDFNPETTLFQICYPGILPNQYTLDISRSDHDYLALHFHTID